MGMGQPYMKLTIEVDPSIKEAFLRLAQERGVPMKHVVVEALNEYLDHIKQKQ